MSRQASAQNVARRKAHNFITLHITMMTPSKILWNYVLNVTENGIEIILMDGDEKTPNSSNSRS